MSGGYFLLCNWQIEDTIQSIREIVTDNPRGFESQVLDCLSEAANQLERSSRQLKAVDYLLSGDNSEESFLKEWEKINDESSATSDAILGNPSIQRTEDSTPTIPMG